MDLRVLEYFLAAAEEENISHAAELLHVSQPTVSRQLKELEQEIGRTLFVRTNKNVTLTEDGILFRETARDILRLYEKAKTNQTENRELEGELNIAAGETESFDLVAGKIREFHQKHPKVLFRILSGNAEEVCSLIDRGIADIGFIIQSADTMKYEVCSLNTAERWGILVNGDHPLAGMKHVTLEDLTDEPLIVPENSRLRNDIREWLGSGRHVAATYTLFRNAVIMTKICGWSAVCLEAGKYISDDMIFIPLHPERTASASLIWRSNTVLSPAMQAFLNEIRNTDNE